MEVGFLEKYYKLSDLFTKKEKEYYIVKYLENRNFKKFSKRKRLIVRVLNNYAQKQARRFILIQH